MTNIVVTVIVTCEMTYEYFCSECDHHWDAEQKISEDALTKCPKCEKETAVRLISGGTGFVLKGGGWFKNGY